MKTTGLINIIHDNEAQQLRYAYDPEIGIVFNDDLKIGEWTVRKNIKICCQKTKTILTDTYFKDSYVSLEFVITDPIGEVRLFNWVPRPKKGMRIDWWTLDNLIDSLTLFFADYPLFSATSWVDYENGSVLKKVVELAQREDLKKDERINMIKELLLDNE